MSCRDEQQSSFEIYVDLFLDFRCFFQSQAIYFIIPDVFFTSDLLNSVNARRLEVAMDYDADNNVVAVNGELGPATQGVSGIDRAYHTQETSNREWSSLSPWHTQQAETIYLVDPTEGNDKPPVSPAIGKFPTEIIRNLQVH